MADVEVSAQISGMTTVMSEIEQLKQAIISLSSMNSGGMFGTGGGGGYNRPAGNYSANAHDDTPSQSTPLGTDAAKVVDTPVPKPVPTDMAVPVGGHEDRYTTLSHKDQADGLMRVQHDRAAMAMSGIHYGTSVMNDLGLGHLAGGIQQMLASLIDAKRMQENLVTLNQKQNELLDKVVQNTEKMVSGGLGSGGVTGGSDTEVPSVAGGAGTGVPSVAGRMGKMLDGAMAGMAKASPYIAGGYAAYALAQGISQFADEVGQQVGNQQLLDLRQKGAYRDYYGGREAAGFGTGPEEATYYREKARLERSLAEEDLYYSNPFSRGFAEGVAGNYLKTFNPIAFRNWYEKRREAIIDKQRDLDEGYKYKSVYSREFRSYGITKFDDDQTRQTSDILGVLGGAGTEFVDFSDAFGLMRGVGTERLSKVGLTGESGSQTLAALVNYLARNPEFSGGVSNVRNLVSSGEGRGGVVAKVAMEMLLSGDAEGARQMFALGTAMDKNLSFDTFNKTSTQLLLNEGYSRGEQGSLNLLGAQRTSLEQLGGSREDIYANLSREGGMYESRITEARYQRSLATNPETRNALDAKIANLERERSLAQVAPLQYAYQTVDYRASLISDSLSSGMTNSAFSGVSYQSGGMQSAQGGIENSLMTRIQNLRNQANDPNLFLNAEARQQLLNQASHMEVQLRQSRRGYMGQVYGEIGAGIGRMGAEEMSVQTLADIYGGDDARVSAQFNSLGAPQAQVGFLRRQLSDIDSGAQPATAGERVRVVTQLTEALTRLTVATNGAQRAMFDIPAQSSALRAGIASANMGAGTAYGFGGLDMYSSYSEGQAEANAQLQIREQRVAFLRSQGHDENSPQLLTAKKQVAEARKAVYENSNAYANSQLSVGVRSEISRSQYELQVLNSLPGMYGSRRAVMGEQMNSLYTAMQEIGARMSAQEADGSLTPEGRLAYQNQLQQLGSQRVGLFAEMSYGWQNRLASTMVNAPGNINTVLPGLSYRAAVGSGVRNPLFGSTIGEMPDLLAHAGLLGSISGGTGTPMGMANTALTRGSASNPLYVKIIGDGGARANSGPKPGSPLLSIPPVGGGNHGTRGD